MNKSKISVVLVRLGAIAVLLSAIYYLAQNHSSFFTEGLTVTAKVAMFVLSFVVPVGIAGIIWNFPATVIGQAVPEAQETDDKEIDAEGLLVIGTALLGLYVFVFGLLDTLYWESLNVWERSLVDFYESSPYQSSPGLVASRIASFAQVALGLALMIGRNGISQLILKMRGRTAS